MVDTPIRLDVAVDLTRTGDLWLFRGHSTADQAIRAITNSPVRTGHRCMLPPCGRRFNGPRRTRPTLGRRMAPSVAPSLLGRLKALGAIEPWRFVDVPDIARTHPYP